MRFVEDPRRWDIDDEWVGLDDQRERFIGFLRSRGKNYLEGGSGTCEGDAVQ
jgi:hypothetical protein